MIKRLIVLLLLAAGVYFAAAYSGSVLVANAPVKSDVILVLAGDWDTSRFWHAKELMEAGYAPLLVMDVQTPISHFGVPDTDLAQSFILRNLPGRGVVCEVFADSTFGEAVDVARCLQPLRVSSVLIVTSPYHSRRALTIFEKRLPQYQWRVAAVGGPLKSGLPWERTADKWWKNRRWAKTVLDEWQKWFWWLTIDRWRATPITAN